MNRIVIAVIALSLASAARAQEAQPQEQSGPDVAALEGRLSSLEEQLAEAKGTLGALARIKWSGYMQARYAWQECVGNNASPRACTYNDLGHNPTSGAATGTIADRNNFFIRRGRFKLVYDGELAQFVLQLDAIPSGVSTKEAYASVKLPKLGGIGGLAIDAGLQLMPFGYDVGVRSSSDLDLLERYRGAGQWLRGEYDLGVSLRGAYGPANLRVGVFNGNGVEHLGGRDNDQYKDVIGRLGFDFGVVTGGVSGWWGKTRDYHVFPNVTHDRKRLGADAQVFLDLLPVGGTALKGEFIVGTTALASSSSSSASTAGSALGVTGHAWHVTLTQNLGQTFQAAARFESFVANNNLVASTETVKEIRQLDVAAHAYIGGNYKLTALYSHPMNGETIGSGGTLAGSVDKTDQFIVQAQAKF